MPTTNYNYVQSELSMFHRSGEAGLLRCTRRDKSREEAERYVQHLSVVHSKSRCNIVFMYF